MVRNFIFTLSKLTNDGAQRAETLEKIFVHDRSSYDIGAVVASAALAK
jgi:hypothetical protein